MLYIKQKIIQTAFLAFLFVVVLQSISFDAEKVNMREFMFLW